MADAVGLNLGRILFELSIVGRQNVENEIKRAETRLNRFAAAIQSAAMDITLRFSLVNAVIAGFATKSAVEFDKAMTNVQRTSGLSRGEVNLLGESFLKLSKTLPTANAAQALANIAVIAGKLGLEGRDEIEAFTLGINKLVTVFDNLDAEETATKMAQIAQAFGIPYSDIERLGSVISEIDNRSTATTRELIVFTQMVAGAGKVAGLSAPDIIGMAGAIKDVGLRTEVAATAVTNLFTKLITQPEKFAHTIGVSTAEFKRRIEEDGVAAIMDWLAAMQKLNRFEQGEALEALAFRGQRATNVLTLLSQNLHVLRERVAEANEEQRVNLSLTRQWEVANTSMAAKMNRVVNEGRALAIELGQNFFPVLEALLKVLKGVISAIAGLPPVLKNFLFAMSAVLAMAGPFMLFFGNTLKLIGDVSLAFRAAAAAISSGATSLGAFISMVGPQKVILLAFTAVAVGLAAAFALFNNRQKELRAAQARLNSDLDRAIKAEIERNEAILRTRTAMEQMVQAEKKGVVALEEKQRVYREVNALVPGLIRGQEEFSEALTKVKKEADNAAGRIRQYTADLEQLRRVAIGQQIREQQEELAELTETMEEVILGGGPLSTKGRAAITLRINETALMWERGIRNMLLQYPHLFSQISDFMQRSYGVTAFRLRKEATKDAETFKQDMSDLIFALTNYSEKMGRPERAEEFITHLQAVYTATDAAQKSQKKLNDLLDERNGLMKEAVETPPPPIDPEVALEDLLERAELLKSTLALLQAILDRKQAEIAAQKDLATDEERQTALRQSVLLEADRVQGYKAGTPILVAYEQATEALYKALRGIAQLQSGKERNATLAEAVALQTKLTREQNQSLGRTKEGTREEETALKIRIRVLQMQQEMYDVGLQMARFQNEEGEYMANNAGTLARILETRHEIAEAIEREVENVLQIGDLTLTNLDDAMRAAATVEGLQEEERERVLELIRLYGQLRGWTPAPVERENAWDNAKKEIEKWGLTAESVSDSILANWRRMNNRIVDMLFDTRLTLRDVWEGIAKDFLSMLLDEMLKKGLMSFLDFIASLGTGGIPFLLPELPLAGFGDFLVRKNGQVIRFSEDDSVVGFKSIEGLLSRILPTVVAPGFGTLGQQSINFAPSIAAPQVSVPAPQVIIYADTDAVKFMTKADREFREYQNRRRLNR